MFKPTHFLLLALLAAPAFAAPSESFAKWVPNGWKLIAQDTGDLNRDGIDDIVLVTEETNPANLKENTSLGPKILNLNPRRLIILLNSANGFKEILRKDDLLPSENEENAGCLADPLDNGGTWIAGGNLVIKLKEWLSCGSYGVTHEAFTFRLQGTRFQLIGYDRTESSRSTGERSEFSTNYLTGKKKITTGLNEFKGSKPKVSWEKLSVKRVFFLDEISLYCETADPKQKDSWCQ